MVSAWPGWKKPRSRNSSQEPCARPRDRGHRTRRAGRTGIHSRGRPDHPYRYVQASTVGQPSRARVLADAIPSFSELAQGQATDLSMAGKIDSHTTIGGSRRYVHRDAQGAPDGILVFEPKDGVADYPLVVVRKNAQRQGIASRLYKSSRGRWFRHEGWVAYSDRRWRDVL